MELQGRPVKFDDLVSFIDREARIATSPVFGQITESSKILEARSSKGTVQKLLPKSRKLSLAAQVNTDHGLDTEVNRSIINIDTSQHEPDNCFANLCFLLLDFAEQTVLSAVRMLKILLHFHIMQVNNELSVLM